MHSSEWIKHYIFPGTAESRWSDGRGRGKLFRVPMKAATAAIDYVVKNGKRTVVILPIDEYEELLQDLDDLAVITRRKNEPTIPLAEVKRRLKRL
jgi:hypothetical protein